MDAELKSEDTLIFNALTPGVTKMGTVYKAIKNFCEFKKYVDPSDRFNFIIFHEEGPNYLEDFTLNPENVLSTMKSLEKKTVRANVAGGIFVAITFIIDVYKKISDKCFRLIILTDSGSFKVPTQFVVVLQDLIDKVYNMPFFIDIVRINVEDPEEDYKLMLLAQRCNGNIHRIGNIHSLQEILEVLAIKREIPKAPNLYRGYVEIPEQNQPFYENLAEQPTKVTERNTCSICFKEDIKGLVMCPKCDTIVHKECWSHWARTSSIGIFNVFRCHNCYNLIKIDKEYVFAVHSGVVPTEEVLNVAELDFQDFLEALESEEGPKLVQIEDPMAFNMEEYEDDFKIDLNVEEIMENPYGYSEEINVVWCPYCSTLLTSDDKVCPECGHQI